MWKVCSCPAGQNVPLMNRAVCEDAVGGHGEHRARGEGIRQRSAVCYGDGTGTDTDTEIKEHFWRMTKQTGEEFHNECPTYCHDVNGWNKQLWIIDKCIWPTAEPQVWIHWCVFMVFRVIKLCIYLTLLHNWGTSFWSLYASTEGRTSNDLNAKCYQKAGLKSGSSMSKTAFSVFPHSGLFPFKWCYPSYCLNPAALCKYFSTCNLLGFIKVICWSC